MLTLESQTKDYQKCVECHREFGYQYPETLAEIEIIQSTVLMETGIKDYDVGVNGRGELSESFLDLLETLEIAETCWQEFTEKMIYLLVKRQRKDIIDKLAKAREWSILGLRFLNEMNKQYEMNGIH